MSSPRVVASAAVVIASVLATGWYASSMFPIVAATPAIAQADRSDAVVRPSATREWTAYVRETQESLRVLAESTGTPIMNQTSFGGAVPRFEDRAAQGPRSGGAPRPGPVAVASPATAGTNPITPENPIPRRLSSVPVAYPPQLRGSGYRGAVTARVTLDASGRISEVERLAADVLGDATTVDRTVAATAFFDATAEAVRQWRYQSPADPPIAFFVSARFDAERDAVASQSDVPARQAQFVAISDPARRELALIAERVKILTEQRAAAARSNPQSPEVAQMDLQLAKAQADARAIEEIARELDGRARVSNSPQAQFGGATPGLRVAGPGAPAGAPVRVGGNVPPPTKTRHIAPVYPPIAQSARVQGVVILEAVIDEQGRIAEARVLRSIPLLDQAALDAVRQWEFTPTLLNGAPVPVIMTVTVQFTLPEAPPQ